MRLPIRCVAQALLQVSQESVLYPSACCSLFRRPMASDEESSWHSGMAILEQRSTSRSAGSSARNTEVPAADTSHPQTSKNKPKKKSKSSKTSKKTNKTKKRRKHKRQTTAYQSSTPSGSSNESAYINQDHHLQIYQHHASVSTHQASATATSARTGEAPRSRACAKMLVRAGYRCPCHFLRECPSVLFLQPVTLMFHTASNAD